MGFSKENYAAVEGLLLKRRQESELLAEKHTREVHERCPEIAAIDRCLAGTGFAPA